VLGSIRDVLSKRLTFEYSQPVIFANLRRSQNSRNISIFQGFTVRTQVVKPMALVPSKMYKTRMGKHTDLYYTTLTSALVACVVELDLQS